MIRRIVRSFRASKVYFEIVWQLDALFARIASLRSATTATSHVLLAATGGGNIGDQAMFESYIQNVEGRVVVIVSDTTSLTVPESEGSRVEVLEIPSLIKGLPFLRLIGTAALLSQLKLAKSYSVIGADIMDGVYSPEQSLARLSTVNCALLLGVDARILGFSWSPAARPTAKEAMRRLDNRAAIFARDPRSLERLIADGVSNAVVAADIVFSHRTECPKAELSDWIQGQKNVGRRIAVVNVSGLISAKVNLEHDYVEIVRHLKEIGYSIIILPHVIRHGDDDLAAILDLTRNNLITSQGSFVVRELLAPSEVKALVKDVDFVLTGRMHLAVIALSMGVPTVTLGTQGKVEGLYAMFGLEELCIQPVVGMSATCARIVDLLASHPYEVIHRIEAVLPEVLHLSGVNFGGIGVSQRSDELRR